MRPRCSVEQDVADPLSLRDIYWKIFIFPSASGEEVFNFFRDEAGHFYGDNLLDGQQGWNVLLGDKPSHVSHKGFVVLILFNNQNVFCIAINEKIINERS